ncbi:MAG: HAD family hydrolase [Bacteroidota bacterium]
MKRILVVLDLDETLIHSIHSPIDDQWDFEIYHYKVYKRPYLDEFLERIKRNFRVAIWSSASDDYVKKIVEEIFPQDYPLEFVWGRSRCTRRLDHQQMEITGYHDPYHHSFYVKRPSKLKRSRKEKLEKVIIVDDTPNKAIFNYGNAIYPTEFTGDPNDDELLWLIQYLDTLKEVDNVRTIEKRGWKEKIRNGRSN